MQIKARFIGKTQTRKHPYEFAKVYHLVIRGNHVFNEVHQFDSPEMTIEEFLTEWIPLKPGD